MSAIAVIDFETSGFSPKNGDRTIEVGVVIVEGDRIVDRYQSLMNPGFQISSFIEKYTGITNSMVAKARSNEVVMDEVCRFVASTPMAAHNASFDRHFWESEMEYLGSVSSNPFVCTMRLSRVVHPGLPSYKLEALAKHHAIPSSQRAHRAMADAEVTAALLGCIRRDLHEVHGVTNLSHSNLMVLQGAKAAGSAFESKPDFSKVTESRSRSLEGTSRPATEPMPNGGALTTICVSATDNESESRAIEDATSNAWESVVQTVPGKTRTKSYVVYRILNTKNGRFYIGSSAAYERRVEKHKRDLIDGTHHNFHLMEDLKHFAMEDYQFRVLAKFDTRKEMLAREQLLITMYWGTLYCLNIDPIVEGETLPYGYTATNGKTSDSRDYLSLHAIKTDLGIPKSKLRPLLDRSSITIGDWKLKRSIAQKTAKDSNGKTEIIYAGPSLFGFHQNRHRAEIFTFINDIMQPEYSADELQSRLYPDKPDRGIHKRYLAVALKHGIIEKHKDKDKIVRYRIASTVHTAESTSLSAAEKLDVNALLEVMVPIFSERELYCRSNSTKSEDFYKFHLLKSLASGLVTATLPVDTPREEQRYVCTGKTSFML